MTGWNEYDAARHVLEAPLIAARMALFIEERSFDWDGIDGASATFSSGEKILVDAARVFWDIRNDEGVLGRALHTLDDANLQRLLEAVLIYAPGAGPVGTP